MYLASEEDADDPLTKRGTVAWLRNEFAAAAHRHSRHGIARLVLIDTAVITDPADQAPTVEQFAESRGMRDFSWEEQYAAYTEVYGGSTRRSMRRQRLIERQLTAITWLEDLIAQTPKAQDGVAAWFAPPLAAQLTAAGIPTLSTLLERINARGSRWHGDVRGVGSLKAARVVAWLRRYEESIGATIGIHALVPIEQADAGALAAVVPAGTALVPLEKFLLPRSLDGSTGRYRAPADQCLLAASNDYEALLAWLNAKHAGKEGGLSATQRAYRKEGERLLLWAILERHKPLSSLSVDDAIAYRDFLTSPPTTWCGPRYRPRWSPEWRPLEGPLSGPALRHALVIVRTLYAFLMQQHYVVGNPFAGVSMPRERGRPLGSKRTLTFAQWDFIEAQLRLEPDTEPARRRARAIRWLYSTGLRLSEIVDVRCGDLSQIEYTDDAGALLIGWMLSVTGKGDRERQVPIPNALIDDLGDELASHGRDRNPSALSNRELPLLHRPAADSGWSPSGLYQALKGFLKQCAAKAADPADAAQIARASTHWLRHTHGSHALNGRPGHAPVPVQIVQNNLGHSSIGTTSGYLTTERDARLKAMQGFWGST